MDTGTISDEGLADWRTRALSVERAVGSAVIGQPETVRLITVALFARGHVLLEGDVGVGKTTVLRAFARVVGGDFERVEGTVDLMPGDLVYHAWVDADGQPRIDPGPLLRHGESLTTFFFNEINRARPQVQSLLLRAMAERSVSAFGREFAFPHMTVFADRNRVEREETFELASAARDRFMFELNMATPLDAEVRRRLVFDTAFHDVDALLDGIDVGPAGAGSTDGGGGGGDGGRDGEGGGRDDGGREGVPGGAVCRGDELNAVGAAVQGFVRSGPAIERYVLELWRATERPAEFGVAIDGVDVERLVLAGASPRGIGALVRAARVVAWLDERDYLAPEDLHAVLPSALGHRIFFQPIFELRRSEIAPRLVAQIMDRVASP